jgi:hypothetical protein
MQVQLILSQQQDSGTADPLTQQDLGTADPLTQQDPGTADTLTQQDPGTADTLTQQDPGTADPLTRQDLGTGTADPFTTTGSRYRRSFHNNRIQVQFILSQQQDPGTVQLIL